MNPMCPKCRSTNTWDDNFWWGCRDCGWANNFEQKAMDTIGRYTQSRPDRTPMRCEDDDGE